MERAMDHRMLGEKLETLLGLTAKPVALTFSESVPAGFERVERREPAGCAYWRLAGVEGRAFYTEASDHHCCPIGAHTHGVELSVETKKELGGLLETMVKLEYLTMDEVSAIPTMKKPFRHAVYAPLEKATIDPDVVLVRGNVRQLMLIQEAAQAAKVAGDGATLGRPTCAVIPQAIESKQTSSSFGCIGNRVYTEAKDDEGYVAIPGRQLEAVVQKLGTIVRANEALEKFHMDRRANA
jgi:uncharacterized protein (DUF169 family)